MNIWEILDLQVTNDKKKIKSAYRAKLRELNPESEPEAFMELREAYEKALKESDKKKDDEAKKEELQELSDNKNPIACWKEKLKILYKDNSKRFQTKEWEALFLDDVCFSLDTRDEAGKEFMAFFGEYSYISQEVLKKAEEVFHFTQKIEQLKEEFPWELVDYFISYKLKEEEFPQYKYFAQNPLKEADYDQYIEDFLKLCVACDEDNKKEAMRILKRLDETGIRHPSTEIKRAYIYRDDEKIVNKILDDIENTWGEYDEAIFLRGEQLLEKNPKEAEKCFRRVLEMNPDFGGVRALLAFSLRAQKKYVEARDVLMEANDPQLCMNLSGFLGELEEEIIKVYEKQLQTENMAEEDIYSLAFAYYAKNRIKEAQKTIDLLKGKEKWELKYLRLCIFILESQEEWEKLLPLVSSFIEKLETQEKTDKNLSYLAEAYMILGRAKLIMKQKKDGLEYMDKAIALSSNQEDFLLRKVSALMKFEFYELAADVWSQLLKQDSRSLMYRFGRGICYFRLGELQDAYDDFDYICIVDENNIEAHIYKMRIYLEVEDKEEIEQLFQFFDEKGFDTDSVRLMRGIYQEYSKDYKNARKTFEEIIKGYDAKQSDLDSIGEVYLHLAQIDVEEDKRGITIFKHLDQGLKKDPTYIPLLEKRCEMNEIFEIEDDMEKDVMEILRLNPYHEAANAKMSDIYEEAGQMDKAMEYLDMQQQVNDGIEVYLNRAYNKILSGEFETAWKNIELAEAREKETLEVYRIKGLYYSFLGENEKAIKYYTLSNEEDEEENFYEEIGYCYCHMGDFDAARKQYEKILQDGDKELAYELLFELELEQGDYRQAEKMLKLWQSSRRKLFKDDIYRVKVGRLFVQKREYRKAKAAFDQAEVNESLARRYLGMLNLYEGKPKKALKYFLSAIKEWPEDGDLYSYAAIANLILGRDEEVKKLASMGLALKQKNTKAGGELKEKYQDIGEFYILLRDFENAQKYLDKALKSPLCWYCKNCLCHEIYIRMALLHYFMGEEEKCQEMLERASEIQPNDLDVIGLRRLMKEKLL